MNLARSSFIYFFVSILWSISLIGSSNERGPRDVFVDLIQAEKSQQSLLLDEMGQYGDPIISKIYDDQQSKKAKEEASIRKSMVGTGDRSEKIRTYNFPQNRLTDHRINLTLYKLDRIIEGDLNETLNALYEYDLEQKLMKQMNI